MSLYNYYIVDKNVYVHIWVYWCVWLCECAYVKQQRDKDREMGGRGKQNIFQYRIDHMRLFKSFEFHFLSWRVTERKVRRREWGNPIIFSDLLLCNMSVVEYRFVVYQRSEIARIRIYWKSLWLKNEPLFVSLVISPHFERSTYIWNQVNCVWIEHEIA